MALLCYNCGMTTDKPCRSHGRSYCSVRCVLLSEARWMPFSESLIRHVVANKLFTGQIRARGQTRGSEGRLMGLYMDDLGEWRAEILTRSGQPVNVAASDVALWVVDVRRHAPRPPKQAETPVLARDRRTDLILCGLLIVSTLSALAVVWFSA